MIWILILIVFLVSLDKAITFINVKQIQKNSPEMDAFSIEKNPLAKLFFVKCGLVWGSIIYWFISLITFVIALKLFDFTLRLFHVLNSFSIALYIMIIIYCMVIGNNVHFLLRASKIIN